MKIKIIKIISFVLIFFVLLYAVNNVLKFKYFYLFDSFYKLKNNSIDVLLLGSSHSYVNINSFYLYKLYGISSFNFGGSIQPLWNTYFYLKEALKKQKPKLIVLDALTTTLNDEYADYSGIIKNNYELKFSFDKINSIIISSPKNICIFFLNPLYQYHNRYSSLTFEDFLSYRGREKYKYYKGYVLFYRISSNTKPNVNYITNEISLYPKIEKYYRIVIELAKNNNIPILIVKSPYSLYNEYDQKKYNTAKKIAEEYNVPFINLNYNYDDYNLDFSKDFYDQSGHLNYKGAEKLAKYLGKYLKENYDLPDRRGDPKYYSWEMNAKYQDKEIYNFELTNLANLNEYIEKVKNADDYIIGITMLGNYQKNDNIIQSIVSNFNINNIYLQNSSYVIDNNNLIYSSKGSSNYLFYKEIGNYTDLVVNNEKLSINRTNYIKSTNGINMVIYDKFTEEIVDNIYLEYDDNSINPTIKR